MNSFLKQSKIKDLLLEKMNFFASSDEKNKIYKSDLPHIKFQFLWFKRKVIAFYNENKSFLDKNPLLLKQLLSIEYAFKI